MKFIKRRCLKFVFTLLALIFAFGVISINQNMDDILERTQLRLLGVTATANYESARVIELSLDDIYPDKTWNSGVNIGIQSLTAEILTGVHKGDEVNIYNAVEIFENVALKVGDIFIVRIRENNDVGGQYVAEVFSHNRPPALLGAIGAFILLLIFIGGKKGVKSLVGLIFTLVCVCLVFMPLVFRGVNAFWAVMLIVALTSFVTLTLTGGWNHKSAAAITGTISGVIAASVIAGLTAWIAKISTFNASDVEPLTLLVNDAPLKLNNLLFAGVVIAALGAVMDVGISVASAMNEIHGANAEVDRKQLFKSGMNVGKDMIGTMSNTLILAFVGSSVNILILLYAYDLPFNQLLNLDMLAIEVLQAIAGSIGIILTIPITAYIAAWLFSNKQRGN